MNPLLRAFESARGKPLPFVGKVAGARDWQLAIAPREEWGGWFYEVTADAVFRHSRYGVGGYRYRHSRSNGIYRERMA